MTHSAVVPVEPHDIASPGTAGTARLRRWSSVALGGGGIVTIVLNVAFTPFMTPGAPFAEAAASTLYLWRQSASALAAGLLLFGSIGLYLRLSGRTGIPGAAAFVVAFFGTALLLAWEWVDVFVLRPLAFRAPAALQTLEEAPGIDLYDLGALIPVSTFALGWLALAVVTLRSGLFPRRAPQLVIAGFFLAPLLTPVLGLWAPAAGSVVLGAGWLWLARDLYRDSAQPGYR